MANKVQAFSTANSKAKTIDPIFKKENSPIFLYLLGVLMVFLPFVHSVNLFDPAFSNRYIFLLVYLVIFFILFLFLKPKIPFKIPKQIYFVFALGLIYILWNILGTIFALNPLEGFIEITIQVTYFIFFIVIILTMLVSNNALEFICKTLVCIALIHSLTGIFQYYNIGGRSLPAGLVSYPYGFNANRNFYGSFIALLVPFCGYVLYTSKNTWQYFTSIVIVFCIGAITISQTRAAWLSTLISIIFVSSVLFLKFKSERFIWLKKIGLVFICSVIFVFLLISFDVENKLLFQLKDKVLGTVALTNVNNIDSLAKGSAESNAAERIEMFKKTIPVIKDNLLLGVGRNNWKLVVGRYSFADVKAFANGINSPDYPHNVYMYIAAETGIVGVLLLLSFIMLICKLGIHSILKQYGTNKQDVFLLSGLICFGIDCLFSFSDTRVEHMMILLFTIGCIVANFIKNKREQNNQISLKINTNILFLSTGIVLLFNLYVAMALLNYDKHLTLAIANYNDKNYAALIAEAKESKSQFISMGGHIMPLENLEITAFKELKKFKEAELAFETGKKKTPYLPHLYTNIGLTYMRKGEPDKAIVAMQTALSIAPMYNVAFQNLAIIYYNKKQYDSSYIYLKKIDIDEPVVFTEMLKVVANDFFAKNEIAKCLEIVEIHKRFKNERPWFDSFNNMVQLKIKK